MAVRFSVSSNVDAQIESKAVTFAKTFGVGFVAGGLGSLVGLGGGFIIIPGLVAFMRATQHQAHGTSLAAIVASAASGAYTYASVGSIDFAAAGAITVTAMASSPFGARVGLKMSGNALKFALGLFMMVIAPLVPLKGYFLEKAKPASESSDISSEPRDSSAPTEVPKSIAPTYDELLAAFTSPAFLGTGAVAGFLAGLFGVGGGALMVPALALFTPLTQHTILGTSLAAMVFPAVVGALTHHQAGNVMVYALIPLALGSATGARVGGELGILMPEEGLRWLFALLMGANGAKFAWAARPGAAATVAAANKMSAAAVGSAASKNKLL